ncbi:MAG: hypothetical protein WC820_03860 [Spirochaetales bacterium]|jgi:hypothetical protein
MKSRYALMILIVGLLAVSCALGAKDANGTTAISASVPTASIAAPADIKDIDTWTATYNYVISQYVEVVARKNAGDSSTLNRSLELIAISSDLNTVGETLDSSLSGQDRVDFEARMQGFKEEFSRIATMY